MSSRDKFLVTDAKPITKNGSPAYSKFNTSFNNSAPVVTKAMTNISSTQSTKQTSAKYQEFNKISSSSTNTTSPWKTTSFVSSSQNSTSKSTSSSLRAEFFNTTPASANRNAFVPSIANNPFKQSSTSTVGPLLMGAAGTTAAYKDFREGNKYITTNSYVSPYRNTIKDPRLASSSEIAKWPELKTNAALYKKSTATVNSIQAPLAAAVLIAPILSTKNKSTPTSTPFTVLETKPLPAISKPYIPKPISQISSKTETYTNLEKKGYIIIFNQEEFKDRKMKRESSRRDEESLCRVFYNFGFEPKVKRNSKYNEILDNVKKVSKKDFKDYSCFVAVVLSHGTSDETIFAYDKPFNLNHEFIHPIARNPSLNGKPKIFIISACKGDQEVQLTKASKMMTDSVPFFSDSEVPQYRDILKVYSTYEGFVSYRNPLKGTIFIQTFCDMLNKNGATHNIEDIIKQVNKELTEGSNMNKQVPTMVSTMSSNFCFGHLKQR